MSDRRSFAITLRALCAAAAVALAGAPATAQSSAGATMTVSATVLPSCSVQAGAMAFGALESASPQGSAQAAVTLECTPGTAYAVTMDQGLHGSRRMADESGSGFLDYEIYQDAAGTRPWGYSAAEAVAGVAEFGKVALSAYGKIAGRSAAPGRYEDVVTVMVQF